MLSRVKPWSWVVQCWAVLLFASLLIGMAAMAAPAKKLTYWWWPNQQLKPLIEYIVEQFGAEYPDVDVEMVMGQGDDKLTTLFAAGTAPDVYETHFEMYAERQAKGMVLDLSPYAARDRINPKDYIPATYAMHVMNNALLALPTAAYMDVLYYNVQQFAEVGLGKPREEWDWDEFAATMKRLTRDLNGDGRTDVFAFGQSSWWMRNMPFIFQAGGHIWSDKGKAVFDSPEVIEAAEFVQSLRQEGLIGGSFWKQTAATMISGPWEIPNIAINGFEVDVAVLPKKRYYGTRASSMAILASPTTAYPDVAWEFIKFASSAQVQKALNRYVAWLPPAQLSAAQEYVKIGGQPATRLAFIRQLLLDPGHRLLSHPQRSELWPIVDEAWMRIWNAQSDARSALTDANRRIAAILGN